MHNATHKPAPAGDAPVPHPGVPLALAGRTWHFAPLLLNTLVPLLPRLEDAQARAATGSLRVSN